MVLQLILANILLIARMSMQFTIGFSFISDWSRKWHEFSNQSQTVVMQNQNHPSTGNCMI